MSGIGRTGKEEPKHLGPPRVQHAGGEGTALGCNCRQTSFRKRTEPLTEVN